MPKRRSVSTEVIDELDKRLSVAVATLELEPDGERTKLKLTVRLAPLDGPEIIEGTKVGYTGVLDRTSTPIIENLTSNLQPAGGAALDARLCSGSTADPKTALPQVRVRPLRDFEFCIEVLSKGADFPASF